MYQGFVWIQYFILWWERERWNGYFLIVLPTSMLLMILCILQITFQLNHDEPLHDSRANPDSTCGLAPRLLSWGRRLQGNFFL